MERFFTNNSKLIGRKAYITDSESCYFGEWGIIADYDGDYYYIKIANGENAIPVFNRSQFRVPRKDGAKHGNHQ